MAKKRAKNEPKMTDGWLCCDRTRMYGEKEVFIVFFPGPAKPRLNARGVWHVGIGHNCTVWKPKAWDDQYKLKPPTKGKKFYVALQLRRQRKPKT